MKVEARRNDLKLTLETNTLEAHALMTDNRAAVEETLRRAADWFQAEVERLLAPPATAPVFDRRGREIGRRITEANASPLVAYGRKFNEDPLHEFRPERGGV